MRERFDLNIFKSFLVEQKDKWLNGQSAPHFVEMSNPSSRRTKKLRTKKTKKTTKQKTKNKQKNKRQNP